MVLHAIIRLQQFFSDVEVEARIYQDEGGRTPRLIGSQRVTVNLTPDSEALDDLALTLAVLETWIARNRFHESARPQTSHDHAATVGGGGRALAL